MKLKLITIGITLLMFCNVFPAAENITNTGEKDALNENSLSDNYDYIIITSENFKNYNGENNFQDLCDYHSNHGLNSKIVTVEYIDSHYDGVDIQEEIRDYIRDARPKYVLFGGDHDSIPARMLTFRWENHMHPTPAPSELYYSCPDVTWYKGPTDFKPWDHDLSPNDNGLPDYALIGEGLFEGAGEDTMTGEMKWTYKDGNVDQNAYCNINFDEPADLSDMFWMYFDIKTSLKEYPVDGSCIGPSGIAWNGFRCKFTDANGKTDEKIYFKADIFDTGLNSGEWESKEVSIQFKYGITTLDYSKIKSISFLIRRYICDEHDPLELNPGDHILIDKLYFSDYNDNGFVKKEGELKPSVCIGRACVDNTEDIERFVAKTLRYMDTSYPQDEYLENVLLVDSHTETSIGRNTLDTIKDKYLDVARYNSAKYYNKDQDARHVLYNDDNTHLLLYAGHGTWNGYEMGIYNEDISNFHNNNLFFEYSTGCWVGAFDKEDCYAEHLTVKTPNGAFAGIWHTRNSWTGNMESAFDKFWRAVCNWDYTIGEAYQYLIANSASPGKYTQALFGDPAVNIKQPNTNQAPEKPIKPTGETNGAVGSEYWYTTQTTDPDSDNVRYGWDWDGDGEVDEWTGFYWSGLDTTTAHKWDEKGSFTVKVIAEDERGMQSEWSDPLPVSMPKIRSAHSILSNILTKILENRAILQLLAERLS